VPPYAKPAPVEPSRHINPPVHPYVVVHDATYVPPVDHATDEPLQPPVIKKQEPAYHTMMPIYIEIVMKDVYNRAMSSLIMIHKATAGRHIPQCDDSQAKILMQDDVLPFALDDLDSPYDLEHTSPDIIMASFAQILHQSLIPPEGSLIILDPYEAYFNLLAPDEEPKPLIITKESSTLCSILPLVDHQ
ncbi:hypothetical protein EW146_g4725, partial [Bondarzewia mesenterica]